MSAAQKPGGRRTRRESAKQFSERILAELKAEQERAERDLEKIRNARRALGANPDDTTGVQR